MLEPSKLELCAAVGLFRSHASGHEIGNPLIKMESKLSIEMLLCELSAKEALVPAHDFASTLVSEWLCHSLIRK